MVADDLGASAQSEDPLPSRTNDASFLADNSFANSSVGNGSIGNGSIGNGSIGNGSIGNGASPSYDRAARFDRADSAAADDAPPGRVPLWNRLPRSMWLM